MNGESISQSTIVITTNYSRNIVLPVDSSNIDAILKSRVGELVPFGKSSLTMATPWSIKHDEPFSSVVNVDVIVKVLFGQDFEVGAFSIVTSGRRDPKSSEDKRNNEKIFHFL